jgi:hemoglobin
MIQYYEQSDTDPNTLYKRVGGKSFFVELVEKFYRLVAADPILRPLYPKDLEPGKANLAGFLAQYWGGPPDYSKKRGHPKLRLRHIPFSIGQMERDTWVKHMTAAVKSMTLSSSDQGMVIDYFENTATSMMNR